MAVSWLFPEFKFKWLVDESKKHLPLELDFEHEGRNAEKIMHFFKKFPFVKVELLLRFVACYDDICRTFEQQCQK